MNSTIKKSQDCLPEENNQQLIAKQLNAKRHTEPAKTEGYEIPDFLKHTSESRSFRNKRGALLSQQVRVCLNQRKISTSANLTNDTSSKKWKKFKDKLIKNSYSITDGIKIFEVNNKEISDEETKKKRDIAIKQFISYQIKESQKNKFKNKHQLNFKRQNIKKYESVDNL